MNWRIFHRDVTVSTNLDARAGAPGDVFTAGFQTGGRGRLNHRWLSAPGENLMMSAVLDVGSLEAEEAATLPLAVGMAAVRALSRYCASSTTMLKWPNDVFVEGMKLAGILCERHGDNVIAGIGVNVRQREFSPEIASRATSLALIAGGVPPSVDEVRETLLAELAKVYGEWREGGFATVYPSIRAVDYLKGRRVCIYQRDDDESPVEGVSAGILPDGSLDVAGTAIYAGEAHVVVGDGKKVKSEG